MAVLFCPDVLLRFALYSKKQSPPGPVLLKINEFYLDGMEI
jgi:hypothetical protein